MMDRSNLIADVKRNDEKHGIEIFFRVLPIAGTRENLKNHGFRWNHKRACWYAKYTPDNEILAEAIADTLIEEYKEIAAEQGETVKEIGRKETSKASGKPEKVNKYGVKVGDFFSMSWGWEQTNITHFQVVELVGAASVRVREVFPEVIATEAISGMSEDRTYKYDRSKMAAVRGSSVFIKDQDRGDIKRIQTHDYYRDHTTIYINVGHHMAELVTTDTAKEYVSWYA